MKVQPHGTTLFFTVEIAVTFDLNINLQFNYEGRVSKFLNSEGDTLIMESPSSQLYENMALGNAIVFIIHVAWPIFSSVLERPPLCVCVSAYTHVCMCVCVRETI